MNRKNEFTIFFTALAMLGVMFGGGIAYFKTQEKPGGLLADITATIPPQGPTVQTIPTSTIVIATSSASSSIPLPPLALPYSLNASTSNETYWPKAWSKVLFADSSLSLVPDPVHHGANTFLRGAESWSNYAVSADVSWLRGGWFDIIARVASGTQDFVYCEFGSNGTEIIERVNSADTQFAFAAASTTSARGMSEKFGMKVYGNDIACMMDGQEVVGTHVQKNEHHEGGIGFVIFGQPQEQKQVKVSNVHVASLSSNTIIVPFPVAVPPPVVVPPPPVVVAPPPVEVTPPPVVLPPAPTPPQPLMLPYTISNFTGDKNWKATWGEMAIGSDGSIEMTPTKNDTGGEIYLMHSASWTDYTFSANLDWAAGKTFGLTARYHDNGNLVICNYDEQAPGDFVITLQQYVNGKVLTLIRSGIVNLNDITDRPNISASIRVNSVHGWCSLNGHEVSNSLGGIDAYLINAPYDGGVGVTMWDPKPNKSKLIIKSVSVTEE